MKKKSNSPPCVQHIICTMPACSHTGCSVQKCVSHFATQGCGRQSVPRMRAKEEGWKKRSRSCKTLLHQLCLRDSQTGTRGLSSPLSAGVTCLSCLISLPRPQKCPLTPASLQEKCAEQRPVTHSGCYTWVLPSPTAGTPAPLEQLVWSALVIFFQWRESTILICHVSKNSLESYSCFRFILRAYTPREIFYCVQTNILKQSAQLLETVRNAQSSVLLFCIIPLATTAMRRRITMVVEVL